MWSKTRLFGRKPCIYYSKCDENFEFLTLHNGDDIDFFYAEFQ